MSPSAPKPSLLLLYLSSSWIEFFWALTLMSVSGLCTSLNSSDSWHVRSMFTRRRTETICKPSMLTFTVHAHVKAGENVIHTKPFGLSPRI